MTITVDVEVVDPAWLAAGEVDGLAQDVVAATLTEVGRRVQVPARKTEPVMAQRRERPRQRRDGQRADAPGHLGHNPDFWHSGLRDSRRAHRDRNARILKGGRPRLFVVAADCLR